MEQVVKEFRSNTPSQPFCYSGFWLNGATVFHVSPGYETYGINPGDKILSVDGKKYSPEKDISSGSDWWSYWERNHKPGDRVQFLVDRGGY